MLEKEEEKGANTFSGDVVMEEVIKMGERIVWKVL